MRCIIAHDIYFLDPDLWTWRFSDPALQASPVHGILQARILEWVAISLSRGSYQCRDQIEYRSPTLQVDSLPSEPLG